MTSETSVTSCRVWTRWVKFFSRGWIRGHSLRVKKMRVMTVVNSWNGLPGEVLTVEGMNLLKWELHGYLHALGIEGCGDMVSTRR